MAVWLDDLSCGRIRSGDLQSLVDDYSVQRTYDEATQVMKAVTNAGVDLDNVFEDLEDEGIQKFAGSWDELTKSIRADLKDKK